MLGRVLTSILLLVAAWVLIVLTDDTPGWVGWQEALITPVVIFAGWRAMKDLLEWCRQMTGEE
ncbi:hypothetical protein MIN45_P1606 [Methylomarinovum tepidoasis]|uniref:Uncharacterized protein n=1 Tax=Methylomarinovum tepidoasis TaxID=2840183 RepID=A0AAU9CEK1_9GAMM|nr:hypothetical protein [Methylomarinovum sp. IN45]BCX89236.1 hypothetical protein MIN45_P1606 [Methylomarinovum sp. IN45]